jgi:hypothetical protein
VENDSALDRERSEEIVLVAVNGSEPADDFRDAERFAQQSADGKGLVMEPAVGFEPTTC